MRNDVGDVATCNMVTTCVPNLFIYVKSLNVLNWNVRSCHCWDMEKWAFKSPSRPNAPVVKRVKNSCAADVIEN